MTTKGTNHDFDRREDDVNYRSLHTRVTVLEKLVNEVMMPNLTENTRLTASIDARTDEMYTAFTTAKNGIRVITAMGDGIVKLSDIVEKRPKTLLLLTVAAGALWGFAKTGKIPEWFGTILKVAFT